MQCCSLNNDFYALLYSVFCPMFMKYESCPFEFSVIHTHKKRSNCPSYKVLTLIFDLSCELLLFMTGWVNRFANAGDIAMEVAGNTALTVRFHCFHSFFYSCVIVFAYYISMMILCLFHFYFGWPFSTLNHILIDY